MAGTHRVVPSRPAGLVSLRECAEQVQAPVKWLRRHTSAGAIPCVLVAGHRRYDVAAVRRAIRVLAGYTLDGQAV